MTTVQRLVRRNLILGGVAVVLAVVLLLRPSETTAVSSEALPPLLPGFEGDMARLVELARPAAGGAAEDGALVRLVREDEATWVVASAYDHPANGTRVTAFLGALEAARRGERVTTREETFDRYASAEGFTQVRVGGPTGDALVDLAIGKSPGWPESFVRMGEPPAIHRVRNLTPDRARPDLLGWVEPRLWPGLTLAAVTGIDVLQRDEKRALSFERAEPAEDEGSDEGTGAEEAGWRMLAPTEQEADTMAVEDLVRAFTGMRMQDIAGRPTNESGLAVFGLEQPAYRVVVRERPPGGEGEPRRHVLLVGAATEDGDGRYVKRQETPWVYRVTAASVGAFRKAPDELLPAEEEDDEGGALPPDVAVGSPDDAPLAPPAGDGEDGGDEDGDAGAGDGDAPPAPPAEGEGGEPPADGADAPEEEGPAEDVPPPDDDPDDAEAPDQAD